MWNFSTLLPIIISVTLPIFISWWTLKDKRARESKGDRHGDKTELIDGEAKFRADILESLRAAQLENVALRNSLWECQQASLELRKHAADLDKVREENVILNRLLKSQ